MQRSVSSIYINLLRVTLLILLVLYFVVLGYNSDIVLNRYVFIAIYLAFSIAYLVIYKKDSLFCFETPFLLLYVLCTFFQEIILDNLSDDSMVSSVFYTSFSNQIEAKGLLIQTIGLLCFLLAASKVNNSPNPICATYRHSADYRYASNFLGVVCVAFMVFLAANGTFSSWFEYSGNVANYSNEYIVYLTTLFLAYTVFQFSQFSDGAVSSFIDCFKGLSKIYVIEIAFVSVLLLISGNRNEALLILIPPIAAFSIYVKRITNKQFMIGLLAGVALMVIIGVTRQVGVSVDNIKNSEITLFETARDFGFVNPNTNYLVEYTDMHGPILFKNTLLNIFSSIPFVGGIIASVFGLHYDVRSAELTTTGMQLQSNMDSGLGTALIGDIYYTGSFILVILVMYFYGWIIASLQKKSSIANSMNITGLAVYLVLFANLVYSIRAEWTMMFRYIGFTFIIMLICKPFFRIKNR